MKFVFVITNLAGGGAEKVVLTLATGLTARGHDVQIVLLENRIEHVVPEGLRVVSLTEKAPHGWLGKRFLAWRLASQITSMPDLIVSTLPFANEVTILARLPRHWCRIANTLGIEIAKLNAPVKSKRRLARYQRLFNSRPLIAISDGMIEDLRQHIGIVGRIEKIPNPFDFEAIRRAAQVHEPEIPNQPYIVHLGRFNAQKRHDVLLDAWQKTPSDHLLVLLTVRHPDLLAMIKERNLEDRVIVAGFRKNPYPWIANADLLVLSSDHEGLPGVLIEALACGTPVVSTDCPSGPREILAALPECLVPCDDAQALASRISDCLSNPPDTARADLSAFDFDQVIAAYERLAGEP